ncbi:hypothetical protein PP651_gp07 [Aeromonas phage ZPAH14]|uniref:Uncharacterized protein n=1 Tax=Aeromonas phage ZPAH14 TaxID=2924887 RepID=A0AAE9GVZ2_9CAUD|nr:hypothetical protein PP651_gp07 [Aeromonas phage ZPAH14]UOT57999.1 hypothetical protein [Aeromonas phage ZPAH14]
MCNHDHLEQTLMAMLDSGTLSESQGAAIMAECEKQSGKLVAVLSGGIKAQCITNIQANAILKSMRDLAKAEAMRAKQEAA